MSTPPAPHPRPEVRARQPLDTEICGGARSILRLAHSRGWTTRTTYARGTTLDAHGNPSRVVDSLLLRLAIPAGGNAQACAVWTDGKFDLAYKWAPWMTARRIKTPELRAWLRGEG